MQKNNMYFDTHKAKIYRDIYRPSSNLARFFKCILSVILSGQAPMGNSSYFPVKKSR
jgi:hypothetical protein